MKPFLLEDLVELSRAFFALLHWAFFEGKWTAFAVNLVLLVLWTTVYVARAELKRRRAERRR